MKGELSMTKQVEAIAMDAISALAEMTRGEIACSVCRGAGQTKFQRSCVVDGKERICERCHGSGKESLSPALRAKTARELASFGSPSGLAGPATEATLSLLKSGDRVTAETAEAIVGRLERLAASKNQLPAAVKQAIVNALDKQGIAAAITQISE